MKRLWTWLLVCILAVTPLLHGLAEEAAEEPEAEAPQQITYDYNELTVGLTTPMTGNFFTNLWGNVSSDVDVRMMIHGYNLIEWDTQNGMFVPDQSVVSSVAVNQEANGDTTFIIALYDDLVYSDGTPITARDYAFSILLTMAPEMEELGGSVRRPEYIAGYREYVSGERKALSGVRVVADHILTITISAEYLPFFFELGLLDCVPYPISVIAPGVRVADDGNGVYLANADGTTETPVFTADLLRETVLDETTGYRTHPSVSSGPYKLVSYEDGIARFEINPNYKGNSQGEKPLIPSVKAIYIPADEMLDAYKEGSVTLLNRVSDDQVIAGNRELMDGNPLLTSTNYARSGMSFISFNTDRAPLDDLNVRQAIAWLVDRDAMVQTMLGGNGMVARGYFGIGQWMYLLLNGTVLYPVEEPDENADNNTIAEYEAAIEAWEALSLDDIETYAQDPEKGIQLLNNAGWNLNENGEAFRPETDKVRYKKTEEGLVPLQLTLAYAKGSAADSVLENELVQSLAEAGIELKVEAIDADDLMDQYYHLKDVQYDMFFLATNFDTLYDPSLSFILNEEGKHVWRTSALEDEELWELTVEMRRTEPGDMLTYCTRWLEFQKRFMQDLPLLPVYSNVYYDFFPLVLHGYDIAEQISWPQGIIGAYLADYIPEEEAEPEADITPGEEEAELP